MEEAEGPAHSLPISISNSSRRNRSDAEVVVVTEEVEEEAKDIHLETSGGKCVDSGGAARLSVDLIRCATIAAMKLQKVYRGYRTRRMLADSAVVATSEELWWQAIEYARLNHSTISFFNFLKPETATSRWNRVSLNASKVGKGLSKDAKAKKLAFMHWIEAIDPRHRYGHNLHYYYEEWSQARSGQPFFYWLDVGDGKEVNLKDCPRTKLRQQCIKYLGPKEREDYEFLVVDGKILHKLTGKPLNTNDASTGSKWIFVMSTSKRLYAGVKKKGLFHHSSFLAGGVTLAAGRLVAEDGKLQCISAYSGHYKPSDDNLHIFLSFLQENGVNLDRVQICKANEDYENGENGNVLGDASEDSKPENNRADLISDTTTDFTPKHKGTLSGGLSCPKVAVPLNAILQRINLKTAAQSYQLGHQLSTKWSTGTAPRIGCISDYPAELRQQAMEFTKISPQIHHSSLDQSNDDVETCHDEPA